MLVLYLSEDGYSSGMYLGKHRVVLKLTLTQRRGVAGDDDQLSLARAKRLESALVTQSDCWSVSTIILLTSDAQNS